MEGFDGNSIINSIYFIDYYSSQKLMVVLKLYQVGKVSYLRIEKREVQN